MLESVTKNFTAFLLHGSALGTIATSPKVLEGLGVDSNGFVKINDTHVLVPVDPADLEQSGSKVLSKKA